MGAGLWELVDLSTGEVVARCSVAVGDDGAADVGIIWLPGVPVGRDDVERALEMLIGVGRELGALVLKVVVSREDVQLQEAAGALGFSVERGGEVGELGLERHPVETGEAQVLVRELESVPQ